MFKEGPKQSYPFHIAASPMLLLLRMISCNVMRWRRVKKALHPSSVIDSFPPRSNFFNVLFAINASAKIDNSPLLIPQLVRSRSLSLLDGEMRISRKLTSAALPISVEELPVIFPDTTTFSREDPLHLVRVVAMIDGLHSQFTNSI